MTTASPYATASTDQDGRSIARTAVTFGAGAAVATTAIGAIAKAGDVPLVVGEMEIQIPMFAVFTVIGAALGALIATQAQKRAGRPRSIFLATTLVLTALSIVPDVTADATTATKVTLVAAHLVAAAVIIPALAARLSADRRG